MVEPLEDYTEPECELCHKKLGCMYVGVHCYDVSHLCLACYTKQGEEEGRW
jgi:hypothetical protein